MADRNEADALFATRRKKQQEEQAEQERREEMSRKKAEMEAEIRRLEEEARRQKARQEEDRRQAEEEARRVKQEAEEAEARARRAQEMAEEAKRKQEEVRRDEERRIQEKREEEKRARERAVQEKAQAKQEEAERAEERKREAKERAAEKKAAKAEAKKAVKETTMGAGRKADIQPGKKLPVLPLAIGGVAVTVVLVICLVLFFGGKKGGVFGTDCDLMAAKQVLGYDVFYPESFEEAYADGGVYLKYGSVEKGDFSFVYVLGSTQDDMNYMTESTDPTDLIHVMEEYVFGMNDKQVYKMTTESGRDVYCSEYISFDISSITDQEEGVMASTSIMMLPLEGEYLVAVYATMKPSYEEPLEEVTASILDNTY
ncbi:MAG: hypothetical protein UCN44_01955 [Enterocloster sp.]|nr:hypothetical protein [Enterocloster sp.]